MEAIAVGDLHFDGPIASLLQNHEQYVVKSLDRIVETARKKGIRHLILLGDMGHSPRIKYESQIAFLQWLHRNSDIKVWAILGNHDKFSEETEAGHSMQLIVAAAPPNFTLITEPQNIKIDGAPFRFLPWPHASFSKKRMNIAHVERRGTKGESGREFKSESFPDGPEWAVVGHLHTRQRVKNAYYPGTLYQTTFGETEEKFYAHIRYEDNTWSVRFVPFKSPWILRTITVHSKADLKNLPTDKTTLIRLVVSDGTDLTPKLLSKYPNIVKVRPFKSKAELEEILMEDLQDGQSISIRTRDLLTSYMKQNKVKKRMRRHALSLHQKLFGEGS